MYGLICTMTPPKKIAKKRKLLKWSVIGVLALIVFCVLFYSSIYLGLWGPVPSKKQLNDIQQSEASAVFSLDGKLLGKYYLYDRQPITYEDLPKHLIDALVATEDVRFFEHNGIDNQSLFRVFFKTILLQDASSGGGSTITLQLAKNLFGRKDLNKIGIVVTKLQESIIARRIEELYTKEEIITLYFNTVPFSDNTYGIESAAMKFFNKPTSELSVAEAATLVGTLKASHYYNPRVYPERSTQRRNVVIAQMVKYHYLNESIAQIEKSKPLQLDYQYYNHDKGVATYFREHVRKEALKILDSLSGKKKNHNLYRDGLKIYTTIDYKMQQYAEQAVVEHMQKLQADFEASYGAQAPWDKNGKLVEKQLKKAPQYTALQAAGISEQDIQDSLAVVSSRKVFDYTEMKTIEGDVLDSISHYLKFLNTGFVALEPQSGYVKAWVGGINYGAFQYDHVSQSKRQVGSTFKPIVYTTALEKGLDPCSYFPIQEMTYEGGYTPKNSSAPDDDDPYLNYSLQYALSHSVNTIAVRVMMETGIDQTIDQAEKMGITATLPQVPSLALGTLETSVLELAKAYTSYTNKGMYSNPVVITRIEDREGNILYEQKASTTVEPAFSETTAHYMLHLMQATTDDGTAKRLRSSYGLKNAIAGKTGTTQNNRDGWFVGITPQLTTVTWVGNDENIPFKTTAMGQGANTALPIFAKFYQKLNTDSAYKKYTAAQFERIPENLQKNLDCEIIKRDGIIKRLFKNPDKPKKFKKKKKRGFLGIF